jgi:3-deoxy-D-manno-octulosonic-acid transferase
MVVIYNILFTFFFLLSAPFYFFKMWRRGGWKAGFAQRFSYYDSRFKAGLTNRHVLWIHAVSVGEVNIATQLIRQLETRAPNLKVVVSTTTSTGMGELRKKLPTHVLKVYYPIDRPRYVNRALRIINPEAIVLVEAEIWPNFLWRAAERKIPVFLVNARLSKKSFSRYKAARFLFGRIFASFAGVGVQNEDDAARLKQLGCRPQAVRVVGNLKFDAAKIHERPQIDVPRLLRQLGVPEDAIILIGGSTHAGEEQILAQQFQALKKEFPKLFLIVVPRHFERGRDAGEDIAREGVRVVYRMEISSETQFKPGEIECLLVNTTGELKYFYEYASIIFVGKSLTSEGGQNPIEPGSLGKPIIFGPNMQNFEAIATAFVKGNAAIQVRDKEDMLGALKSLLADESKRSELGRNALAVVRQNQGSIDRTIDMILEKLDPTELFIPEAKGR